MNVINQIMYLHLTMILYIEYNLMKLYHNKKLDIELRETYTNKNKLIKLILFTFKTICIEELIFKIYLFELINLCLWNTAITQFICSACFALYHVVYNYIFNDLTLKDFTSLGIQITYFFVFNYVFLQDKTNLESFLIHMYTYAFVLFKMYGGYNF